MKVLLATLLAAACPALVMAQAAPPAKAASKPAVIKKRGGAKVPATVEEQIPVDDDPAIKLTPEDLEIAKRVHTGDIPCELGATVHVTPRKREGFFNVRIALQNFRMHPVESRTGAIRLEDPVAGAMWLQLGNKSMLMSQKMGRRLADECMSPAQAAVAEALKKNPPQSFLEPLKPASAPAAPAAAMAPATPASAASATSAAATAAALSAAPAAAMPASSPASAASASK